MQLHQILQDFQGRKENFPMCSCLLIELCLTTTWAVMYCQIDSVAMGSLLGPSLPNIFVGYQENLLFSNRSKPVVYYRYVDDTFFIFNTERECEIFFNAHNSVLSALQFTVEKENNGSLPFLEFLVEQTDQKFSTFV